MYRFSIKIRLTDDHPGFRESGGHEECADGDADDDEKFDSPKTVLDSRSRILRRLDAQHDQQHEEEEADQGEADPINGQIPHRLVAMDSRLGLTGNFLKSKSFSYRRKIRDQIRVD